MSVVEIERGDGVMVIRMNRPERLNAMSYELMDLLPERLREVGNDRRVHCLVLTGAGRAFCAGGDIQGMVAGEGEPLSFEQEVEQQQRWHSATALLYEMHIPTIAMVNGAAAGGGLSCARTDCQGLPGRIARAQRAAAVAVEAPERATAAVWPVVDAADGG